MPEPPPGSSPGTSLSQVAGRPALEPGQVAELLEKRWGIVSSVTPLPSERDQNWLIRSSPRGELVLKIANQADDTAIIELQQMMMDKLVRAGLPCPHVVPTLDGQSIDSSQAGLAWLITALPGRTLATTAERTESLLGDLGEVLGRAQVALAGFDHPAAHRHLQWDVLNAGAVFDAYSSQVKDSTRAEILRLVIDGYERRLAAALPQLPRSVIHNDANDHNVLVSDGRISGLIDFGDALHTVRVNELAIGCAYAMLDAAEPQQAVNSISTGYRRHAELDPEEIAVLPDLIMTRLAMSVCISAHQRTLRPADAYLRVSEAPAWRLLTRLAKDTR